MKATVYTIEDDYLGIPLIVEGELVDYEDHDPPFIVIQEISHGDKTLELWPFSDKFIEYLKDRIYQTWVNEAHSAGKV